MIPMTANEFREKLDEVFSNVPGIKAVSSFCRPTGTLFVGVTLYFKLEDSPTRMCLHIAVPETMASWQGLEYAKKAIHQFLRSLETPDIG